MIDSRSLGGFIGEKGALLKHKCISYEWKKPLSRLAKDHVTMLQAGKQLGCLINEQVRLLFWFDLKFNLDDEFEVHLDDEFERSMSVHNRRINQNRIFLHHEEGGWWG